MLYNLNNNNKNNFPVLLIINYNNKKTNIEANNINKDIQIGIYSLFVNEIDGKSGLEHIVYNQIDHKNTLNIEQKLKLQNISSEYLPLYKKYN